MTVIPQNCSVCGTPLTQANKDAKGEHEIRNCAQVLLVQRENACDEIGALALKWKLHRHAVIPGPEGRMLYEVIPRPLLALLDEMTRTSATRWRVP
jgi:hypothetical protein